jgi:hypothetical protein
VYAGLDPAKNTGSQVSGRANRANDPKSTGRRSGRNYLAPFGDTWGVWSPIHRRRLVLADEPEASKPDEASRKRTSDWLKRIATIGVPVLIAVLVTALSPLGDALKERLFPTSATAHGTVTLDGEPLAGADVLVDEAAPSATGSNGGFVVEHVGKGRHQLEISGPGIEAYHSEFVVPQGSRTVELGEIDLPAAATVVADMRTPKPIGSDLYEWDLAVWIRASHEFLGRTNSVNYLNVAELINTPVKANTRENLFCVQFVTTLPIGQIVFGGATAQVELSNGTELQLALDDVQQVGNAVRPPGCTRVDSASASTPTSPPTSIEPGTETTSPPIHHDGTTTAPVTTAGTERIALPAVAGQTEDAAVATLEGEPYSLRVTVSREEDPDVAEGLVIRTEPPALTLVDKGAAVTVVVASGKATFEVPNMVGSNESDARAALSALVVAVTSQDLPAGDPSNGKVTAQSIAAGEQVRFGSKITITVGKGAAATTTTKPR